VTVLDLCLLLLSVGVSVFRSVVGFVTLLADSNEQNCMLL